ncbi:MAG: hypothetical protein WD077_05190 [Bacteroidia bacterium]
MSYSIVITHRFEKELKRLANKFPSLKNEFASLIPDISENRSLAPPEVNVYQMFIVKRVCVR